MEAGTGQFAMCPGKDEKSLSHLVWIPGGQYGKKLPDTVLTEYHRTVTGYHIAIKLPATALGLKDGETINDAAIDMVLDDRDGQGDAAKLCRLSLSSRNDSWQKSLFYTRLHATP